MHCTYYWNNILHANTDLIGLVRVLWYWRCFLYLWSGPLHIRLPSILNLSYERLSSQAIVLLENGHDLFLWIGRAANPAIVSTLFGVQSLEGMAYNHHLSRCRMVIRILKLLLGWLLFILLCYETERPCSGRSVQVRSYCWLHVTLLMYLFLGIADPSKLCIMPENSDFSSRVQAIIDALRAERSRHLQLHFIREGDGFAEAYFARFLIEDR